MDHVKGNTPQLFSLLSPDEKTARLSSFLETFMPCAIIWHTWCVSLYKNNRYEAVENAERRKCQ